MLDARDALEVSGEAAGIEVADYVDSWGAAGRRAAAE